MGNKHIPQEYLRASTKQRLALLQGLVDTDGYVAPKGQIEYCSISKKLAEGVRELVTSLGYKASLCEGRASLNGKDCGAKYRVMFYMPNAASIPRKANNCIRPTRSPNHYLRISPAGHADTVCIEVEDESHMFLAGEGMLPTCNSEQVSRRLPAYILGRKPDSRIIVGSHTAEWSQSLNRDTQDIIDTPEYTEVFPGTRLSGKNIKTTAGNAPLRNSDIFEIVGHRGYYKNAGVGGAITGRGFDFGIIDDPVKDAKDGASATKREHSWRWYTSTFYTRAGPGAGILITMTRWNEDDLVGRLVALAEADPSADQWVVINLPAIAEGELMSEDLREQGEPLWPAQKNLEELKTIKALNEQDWSSLWQGRPSAIQGDIFKRYWWQFWYYPDTEKPLPITIRNENGEYELREAVPLPKNLTQSQSWDMAFKDTKSSSYVVGQIWASSGANRYLLDQERAQLDMPKTLSALKIMTIKWPHALAKWVEDKANGPAVISTLQNEMPGLIPINPGASKEARAKAVTPFMQAGNVFLPHPQIAPWVNDFIEECAAFPNATHDDQVDAMSQALMQLMEDNYGNVSLGVGDLSRESPNRI